MYFKAVISKSRGKRSNEYRRGSFRRLPKGEPVRVRNNRPLLCLARAISQRACRFDRVFHALTGECNLVCPYLGADRLHSFCLRRNHMKGEGGMQVTPEEKKTWAEELLRSKCVQLGRLPTKKDFDPVACAQIKAYLGPWPRALEAAGLKPPRGKKTSV